MSHLSQFAMSMRSLQEDPDGSFGFLRFVAWYLFVIFCCMVPACCTYLRRRRAMRANGGLHQNELHSAPLAMRAEAHPYFANFRESQQRRQNGDERVRIPPKQIREALEETTMMVETDDLVKLRGESFRIATGSLTIGEELGDEVPEINVNDDENANDNESKDDASLSPDNATSEDPVEDDDVEMGGVPPSNDNDSDLRFDENDEEPTHLQLPADAPNGNRIVPSACAICLCPYEVGDEVTWSPKESCQHAFHRDCIASWLCKPRAEQQCPCCRQEFCTIIVPTTTTT